MRMNNSGGTNEEPIEIIWIRDNHDLTRQWCGSSEKYNSLLRMS